MRQTNDEFNVTGSTHTHKYTYIFDVVISPNVNISKIHQAEG